MRPSVSHNLPPLRAARAAADAPPLAGGSVGLPAGTKKAEHFCPAVFTEGCFSLAVEQRFAAQRHLQWLGRALLPKGETGAFSSAAALFWCVGGWGQGGNKVSR